MLVIDQRQIEIFEQNSASRFEIELINTIKASFPERADYIGQDALLSFVQKSMETAQSCDIYQKNTSQYWVTLSLRWGLFFVYDPQYHFSKCLTHKCAGEVFRLRLFNREVQKFLAVCYGEDRQLYLEAKERVVEILSSDLDSNERLRKSDPYSLMHDVWPQKCEAIGKKAILLLIEEADKTAIQLGLTNDKAVSLIAILSMFFGAKFLSDPQYQSIANHLQSNIEADKLECLQKQSFDYFRRVLHYEQ